MNHRVPDFEMVDDYPIPSSSGLTRPRKSPLSRPDDDIMELLWQNGQVVMQSQNQRSNRKNSPATKYDAVIPADIEIRSSSQGQVHGTATQHHHQPQHQHQQQLFMQEDEMASWLHYPLVDDPSLDHNFCSDLLCPTSCVNTANSAPPPVRTPPYVSDVRPVTMPPSYAPRPPIPPPARIEPESKLQSFQQLSSRNKAPRLESRPSSSKSVMRESTVVDSSDTPAIGQQSQLMEMMRRNSAELSNANLRCGTVSGGGGVAATTSSGGVGGGKDLVTCDMTVTSSPGCSSASAELIVAAQKPQAAEDRKRKGREGDDTECCQSEDVDFESAEAKKRERSTSTKRSRAAEVHNLSERRRRDRINEKMRALQELVPRCNKSDKASMLDEAIEYLKSLQLQVQMMSMGCGMVPMMFSGIQQYMPPMGMGIGMGIGMGMEMGMNRPIMPFPNVLAGSAMTAPGATAHLGPRFPMPPFHMPHVPSPTDPSRIHAPNQSDQMLNSLGTLNTNQSRIPNFSDPYQQYLGQHHMQLPLHQNQATVQPCVSKPATSRGLENLHNR